MSVKWTARALNGILTVVLMTDPGLAATHAKHAASPAIPVTAMTTHSAARQKLEAIEKRGEEVPAGVRLRFETRLASFADQIDLEAGSASNTVAQRLSAEFGVNVPDLAVEHERTHASWGDLMIAHTLQSNARFAISPAQIFELHQGGMAWTMVAHGLGLSVEPFVSAVENETRVALGQDKADGKVPAIGPAAANDVSDSMN